MLIIVGFASFPLFISADSLDSLHTDGINIYDENNNPVYLISVGADFNEWYNGYFNASDVTTIKNAGGNCVEMHMNHVELLMPTRDVISTSYVTTYIDNMVNLVTIEEMYLIINLADLGVGSYDYMPDWMLDYHGYGVAPYSDETRRTALKDFYNWTHTTMNDNRESWIGIWTYLANRYKDNPYVLFSLVNEPMNSGLSWGAGERVTFGGYYATFMESTIDAIRAVGANNLVFVDKPYSASDWTDIIDINKVNVVWEDHMYIEDDHEYAWWESFVDESVSRFVTTFGKPLFVGEYATIPLNRSGYIANISSMSYYLNNTAKFIGRSFHSWGMLYGEYDSITGEPGALESFDENVLLIDALLGSNPLPIPSPTPSPTSTISPTSTTTPTFQITTPYRDSSDPLVQGYNFNIYIDGQGGLAFQHDFNLTFYIEVLDGVWDGRDCQLIMRGKSGVLYFVSYNSCSVQLYHYNDREIALTVEGMEVDILDPVPPSTGDFYKNGYVWNGTITAGSEVRISWNLPELLIYEENWMLYLGLIGLGLLIAGIFLTVYAFRHYKLFTLGNEETVWEKEILPICILLLIFGFGLLIIWLLG